MRINKYEIAHIALLSRLSLSEEEKEIFSSQLGSILNHIDKLNELDTAAVEPTTHVLSLNNVMRDDLTRPPLARHEALLNAPSHTGKFYRVPKIIE